MKKLWHIIFRDIRVNIKDFTAIFIILFPIIVAFGINAFTPGINDTTVNLALLESEDPEMIVYYEDFAKVELFENEAAVEDRVAMRDNIVGILPGEDGYYVLTQGNEPEGEVVDYGKLLLSFYELDVQLEDTNVVLHDFGKTVPPVKKLLVNMLIIMTSILGGMLIALNIVEEKLDNTVSAINVAPVSRTTWIFGKSFMGLMLPLVGSYLMVIITGFSYINYAQLTLLIIASTIISILVGFIQGLNADDMMTAVAGIKMLMFPMGASVAVAAITAEKWHWTVWWSPFYWLFKGYNDVLGGVGTWPKTLMYTAIVLALSTLVYIYLAPRIRKGLEKV